VRLGTLGHLKNLITSYGNLIRDLPICNIVPQTTTLPRAPSDSVPLKHPPLKSEEGGGHSLIYMQTDRFPDFMLHLLRHPSRPQDSLV
jgi:hypothetical protein